MLPWRTAVRSLAFLLSPVLALPVAEAGTEPLAYEEQTLQVDGTRQVARVPRGYRLELLTDKLDGPRLLTFADRWRSLHRFQVRQNLSRTAALYLARGAGHAG